MFVYFTKLLELMEEKLSRYELCEIKRLHDEQHYRCVTPKYVAQQLARIGLPSKVSRFEVAQKISELEKKLVL